MHRLGVRAQPARVGPSKKIAKHHNPRPDKQRQHKRLIEDELSAALVFLAGRVGDQRCRADAEHLGERHDNQHQIAGQAHTRYRFFSQTRDKIQIYQVIESLKDQGDAKERGKLEDVLRHRTLRQIVHFPALTASLQSTAGQHLKVDTRPQSQRMVNTSRNGLMIHLRNPLLNK